jgi:hypothetical protein
VTAILTDTLNGAGWRGELINKRKDGGEFPVYLSTSAILDEKGRAVALMGIVGILPNKNGPKKLCANPKES